MYPIGIYGKEGYRNMNHAQDQIQQAVTDYLHYTWIFGEDVERDKAGEPAGSGNGEIYPLDEHKCP